MLLFINNASLHSVEKKNQSLCYVMLRNYLKIYQNYEAAKLRHKCLVPIKMSGYDGKLVSLSL